MKNIPLIGYTDKLSLRPGETVSFKVSSTLKESFSASLKRSISADPNPKGIGIVEKDASKYFKTSSFKSRKQSFNPGSYAISKTPIKVSVKKNLNISIILVSHDLGVIANVCNKIIVMKDKKSLIDYNIELKKLNSILNSINN